MLVIQFLDALNIKMSSYLSEFAFPYDVVWSQTGDLVYVNELNIPVPVTKLSGGQKYLVSIAIRCAFADVLHTSFPILVFDEPTTGLDEFNRASIGNVLTRIARMSGKVVIVPTHDPMLVSGSNVIKIKE
jgi:DNA repair exonuclease SbcCD ATPase subunit